MNHNIHKRSFLSRSLVAVIIIYDFSWTKESLGQVEHQNEARFRIRYEVCV
jgi:hypothetical protein